MADNSFEQQVKRELSELRMKPAESVWPAVEAAIQKERKRRWLIWLFLLAGCAGASFWGYYLFNSDNNTIAVTPAQVRSLPEEEQKEVEKEKHALPLATQSQKNTGSTITSPVNTTTPAGNSVKIHDVLPAKRVRVKQTVRNILPGNETKNAGSLAVKGNGKVLNEQKPVPDMVRNKTTEIITNTTGSGIPNDRSKDSANPAVQTQAIVTVNDPATATVKQTVKTTDTTTQVTPAASNTAAPPAPTAINTKKNTWQWNIGFEAGASGLRKGLDFSFNKDMLAASPPATNNGQSFGTGSEPSVKDAFSFGIQLQAKKQIGKKHALGLSAGYSLMQTSMNVGRKVDSVAFWNNTIGTSYSAFYYTTTDSVKYNNQYHFLRLGADLYTPFRLFKKINFQWQLGAGVNILMATNGLHYDPVAKKLFSDNSLYAKTQSYISTGIDLSIGKKPFLYIGPHWQYSFTNLTGRPGGDQHLFLSSVKVSFVLPKKKK